MRTTPRPQGLGKVGGGAGAPGDLDDDLPERIEGADDVFDTHASGVLEVAGRGRRQR